MKRTDNKKRVNFTISISVMKELENLVPAGSRSDFVNNAIEGALTDWGRRKASELLDEARKKYKLKLSTEKILKDVRYGRK
jgi:hypothetical protein